MNGRGPEREVPVPPVRQSIVIIESTRSIAMSFGLNRAEVISRLGADVTVNHLASGGGPRGQPERRHRRELHRPERRRRADRQDRVASGRHLPRRADRHADQEREEGPAGLRRGQDADAVLAQGRRGLRPVLHRDPPRS